MPLGQSVDGWRTPRRDGMKLEINRNYYIFKLWGLPPWLHSLKPVGGGNQKREWKGSLWGNSRHQPENESSVVQGFPETTWSILCYPSPARHLERAVEKDNMVTLPWDFFLVKKSHVKNHEVGDERLLSFFLSLSLSTGYHSPFFYIWASGQWMKWKKRKVIS